MFISESSPLDTIAMSEENKTQLFRRKGGGGAGSAGGGHSGGRSGGEGGKSSSKGSSRAADVAKKHGASEAFIKSRGTQTIVIPGAKASAMAYADGGGKGITLGSNSAFNGRQAGGGSRGAIYGTSHFGSGYPYGGYGSFVDFRPFPFYFYPIALAENYYGDNEYLNVNATMRPGGSLVVAIVQPANILGVVTFRLVGDNSSVITVFDALVANCSVANSSTAITPFSPSNDTWPFPEQVVQYYRASSFALSLDTYNNTATLLANAPTSNDSSSVQIADTLLPSGLNMTSLECINTTIGASVPLADVSNGKRLSGVEIAFIVICSLVGAFLVLGTYWACCCGESRRKNTVTR